MPADKYFGNSPIEITKEDGKKYWRIKTTLPGTEATHICGNTDWDVPQDEYDQVWRGDGCGNPAKKRYRYDRKTDGEGVCDRVEAVEDAADHLVDAAEHLEEGSEKLETVTEKVDGVVDRWDSGKMAPEETNQH